MSMITKRKAASSNRRGMICIAVVVAALVIALLYQSAGIREKNAYYVSQIAQVEEEIAEEKARSEELENLPEYTQSEEYIEKIAREKLGLVYPDETIFKAED